MEIHKNASVQKSTLVFDELAKRRITKYETFGLQAVARHFNVSNQLVRMNAERHHVALQLIYDQKTEIDLLNAELAALRSAVAQNVAFLDCKKEPHQMTDDEFRKCIALEMQSNRASDCIGKGQNWQTSQTLRL